MSEEKKKSAGKPRRKSSIVARIVLAIIAVMVIISALTNENPEPAGESEVVQDTYEQDSSADNGRE